MAIDVIPVQRRFITEDFPVRDGNLVRAPKVGEPQSTWPSVCTVEAAISHDFDKLERSGAGFLAEQHTTTGLAEKLIVRPFLVFVKKDENSIERFGVYVASVRSRFSQLGTEEKFSSWYDLYAAPEEADGLQEKVGTRN